MNGHNVESTTAGDEVQLQRRRHQDGLDSDGGNSGSVSFFEPRTEPAARGGRGSSGHGPRNGGGYKAAEKQIIRFALQLAVLEKAASMLGKLAFVWATVVLLGGFASSLADLDFWSMTVILVGEGARVFGRGSELEWQRYSTARRSAGSSGAPRGPGSRFCRRVANAIAIAIAIVPSRAGGARPVEGEAAVVGAHGTVQVVVPLPHAEAEAEAEAEQRVGHTPDHPPCPYSGWVIVSKNAGVLLNSLQVLSSVACVALSVIGLCNCQHRSRSVNDGGEGDEARNQRPALVLFYSLALAEAALFLLEKAYWTLKVFCCGLLDEISSECELGACGLVALTRFFYDAYSQCIGKSIFDGVKMDLVTFAKELIESDFLDEQLIGVRILRQFARSKSSAPETLRKVGTSVRSIERLVEMLNWKSPEEEEVRRCAAEVMSKLVGKSQNALRVAGIHGSIESVLSLLHTQRCAPGGGGGGAARARPAAADVSSYDYDYDYDYQGFHLVGLLILKKLARDHDNCGKIGAVRGLLSRVVEFTRVPPELLHVHVHVHGQSQAQAQAAAGSRIRAAKRSLQVLKLLVTATGNTGKKLRREVADRVFTVSNLRGILQHGHQHGELQKLAIDVLTGLALDDGAKEGIVTRTGGVVKLLLSLFQNAERTYANELRSGAGEALAMLALESKTNCGAILKMEGVPDRLIAALDDRDLRLNAARILRNLCAYSGEESSVRLRSVTAAMPAVLQMTMSETVSEKLLEASVCLTTQICMFLSGEQFEGELRRGGAGKAMYVERLASILRRHTYPEIKVPRIRRFVVLQAMWLMRADSNYVRLFREVDMVSLLVRTATTSDLECYHVFSGSVGLSQHRVSFSTIVESALKLLGCCGGQQTLEF